MFSVSACFLHPKYPLTAFITFNTRMHHQLLTYTISFAWGWGCRGAL
jgi:hypothetical protein